MASENENRITETLTADGWGLHIVCKDSGGYDRQSKWKATLTRNGVSYAVTFRQGSGLRVWKKGPLGCYAPVGAEYWAHYRQPGKRVSSFLPRLRAAKDCACPDSQRRIIDAFDGLTTPETPTLADILYCIVSDVSSVRYGQDFSAWCSEFGENVDSRKAHRVYKACVKEWRGLVRLGADFDRLEALFQDF
jgi:hypothetical protein